MYREPQLIVKLLGKVPRRKSIRDTGDELLALRRAYFAMLQAAAHHCARPPMPKPLRVFEYELNTFLYCANVVRD
jgi:hypothetical protein